MDQRFPEPEAVQPRGNIVWLRPLKSRGGLIERLFDPCDARVQRSGDQLRDATVPVLSLSLDQRLVILDSAEGEVSQQEAGKSNPKEEQEEDPLSRIAGSPHAVLSMFEGTSFDE